MNFPILYSKSKTGAILEWQILVKDNYFYTVSGKTNGKKVTSEPNYCEPKNVGKKNETNSHEQVILEARSKWNNKLKTNYHLSVEDIDKSKFFEPMLAKVFKNRLDKIIYPVIVDPKLNGMRLISINYECFSRKGEKVDTVPHLIKSLKPIFDEFPNAIIDGEAYNHDYRYKLNELMSILRKTKNISEKEIKLSESKVKYCIYDGYGFAGITKETQQFERRKKIIDFFKNKNIENIEIVIGEIAHSEQDIWDIYSKLLEQEYEGAMVRLNGPYKNGRSANLLKIKSEDDDEGIIISINEGNGNWGNVAKTFTLKWRDRIIEVPIKGSRPEAKEILQNPQNWIGKEVTFLYNGYTGLGDPNYARVDVNNCFKR